MPEVDNLNVMKNVFGCIDFNFREKK